MYPATTVAPFFSSAALAFKNISVCILCGGENDPEAINTYIVALSEHFLLHVHVKSGL